MPIFTFTMYLGSYFAFTTCLCLYSPSHSMYASIFLHVMYLPLFTFTLYACFYLTSNPFGIRSSVINFIGVNIERVRFVSIYFPSILIRCNHTFTLNSLSTHFPVCLECYFHSFYLFTFPFYFFCRFYSLFIVYINISP